MEEKYDFSGWVTKNNIKCSDGRVIRKDAFKQDDGQIVPLVWNHSHNDPLNVLGHTLLENREEGVYGYGKFNDTEQGTNAKQLVQHGDVISLSIYANKLKQKGSDVLHGAIKEVSLVLAGANPGAFIDSIMVHGETSVEEAIIYTGEDFSICHADEEEKEETQVEESKEKKKEKTIAEVFDTLNEEQKTVVYAMIGQVSEDDSVDEKEGEEGEGEKMKHNVFDQEEATSKNILSHSEMETIIKDAKRLGSMKESFLEHAEEYGITNIDFLFPDAKNTTNIPTFVQRDMGWVQKVMSSVHNTPFSRIKSIFADITEDEARAKGYMKGKLKKEEVFSLLKRTTTPTTVYKKQKLDRDDIVDITDFDVIAWLKSEMRMMLDEELARSLLIADGRLASSDDKINEDNIRPISKDAELYTVQVTIDVAKDADSAVKAKAFITAVIKSRKLYKGSGNPTMYTTEDVITDCLLLEDKNGRVIYESVEKLATTLRVNEIVPVPPMTGAKGKTDKPLLGIMCNLNDYNVGADKGGAVNLFDDFDIDYNQQKYLIETRCSGALVKPYSAVAFELNEAAV